MLNNSETHATIFLCRQHFPEYPMTTTTAHQTSDMKPHIATPHLLFFTILTIPTLEGQSDYKIVGIMFAHTVVRRIESKQKPHVTLHQHECIPHPFITQAALLRFAVTMPAPTNPKPRSRLVMR